MSDYWVGFLSGAGATVAAILLAVGFVLGMHRGYGADCYACEHMLMENATWFKYKTKKLVHKWFWSNLPGHKKRWAADPHNPKNW